MPHQLGVRPGDDDFAGQVTALLRNHGSRLHGRAHIAHLTCQGEEALAAQPVGDAQLEQVDRRALESGIRRQHRRSHRTRLHDAEGIDLTGDSAIAPQAGLDLGVDIGDQQLIHEVPLGCLYAASHRRTQVLDTAREEHHVLAGLHGASDEELDIGLPQDRVGNLDSAGYGAGL